MFGHVTKLLNFAALQTYARGLGVKAFPPFPTDFLLPKVALLENTQMHFTRVLLYFSLGQWRAF